MLATPGALPDGPEWLFEVKWDGMRLLADVADGRVRLTSRSERDVTAQLPRAGRRCRSWRPDVLLDGEVVLLERRRAQLRRAGRPDARPGRRRGSRRPGPSRSWCSTCCGSTGCRCWTARSAERRATLERLDLAAVPALSLSPDLHRRRRRCWTATRQRGMEGVVAKRRDSAVPARPAQPGLGEGHPPAHAGLPGRRLAPGAQQRRPDRGTAARGARRRRAAVRRAGRLGAGRASRCSGCCASGWSPARAPPFAEPLPRAGRRRARAGASRSTVVEVSHTGLDRRPGGCGIRCSGGSATIWTPRTWSARAEIVTWGDEEATCCEQAGHKVTIVAVLVYGDSGDDDAHVAGRGRPRPRGHAAAASAAAGSAPSAGWSASTRPATSPPPTGWSSVRTARSPGSRSPAPRPSGSGT